MSDLARTELAQSHEEAFLRDLAGAQDHYEWIVEQRAWVDLGHDSFADWWTTRVTPIMRALSMRPTRDIAAAVIEQVRADEAELPAAQRRTQRELAEMVGVSQQAISSRSVPYKNLSGKDLDETPARRDTESTSPDPAVATPVEPELPEEVAPAVGGSRGAISAAVEEFIEADPNVLAARYLAAFMKTLTHSDDFMEFDPEKLADLADRDLIETLDNYQIRVGRFVDRFRRARGGLRLVSGGSR